MKNKILLSLIHAALGLIPLQTAYAQVTFSAKAHAAFPAKTASWKEFTTVIGTAKESSGKNITGFNAGISARIDLPKSLFLMPEVYFTQFKNEYAPISSSNNTSITIDYNRLDVPVLLGYRVLGKQAGVFFGPVASVDLAQTSSIKSFSEVKESKDVSWGFQIGAEARIKKIIIDARYESSFSKDQRKFIGTLTSAQIQYDYRPSIFLVGLGYEF